MSLVSPRLKTKSQNLRRNCLKCLFSFVHSEILTDFLALFTWCYAAVQNLSCLRVHNTSIQLPARQRAHDSVTTAHKASLPSLILQDTLSCFYPSLTDLKFPRPFWSSQDLWAQIWKLSRDSFETDYTVQRCNCNIAQLFSVLLLFPSSPLQPSMVSSPKNIVSF